MIYLAMTLLFVCIFWASMRFKQYLLFLIFILPFIPPWSGIAIAKGIPIISLHKILLLILYSVWVAQKCIRKKMSLERSPISVAIWVLVVAGFISSLFSIKPLTSFIVWFGHVAYYYMLYFVVYDTIKEYKDIKKAILLIVTAAAILGFSSIIEAVTGYNIYERLPAAEWYLSFGRHVNRMGFQRASGPFMWSLPLGLYFVLTIPLFHYAYTIYSKKIIVLVCWAVTFAGVFFTFARGAILPAMMGLAILLIKSRLAKILVVGTLLLVGLPFILYPQLITRAVDFFHYFTTSIFNPEYDPKLYGSTQHRIGAFFEALSVIYKSPLVGYGVGSILRRNDYGPPFVTIYTDHTAYFTFIIDSGIFAGIAFLVIIFKSMYRFWILQYRHKDIEIKALYLSLAVCLISFAVCIIANNHTAPYTVFFILLALGHKLSEAKNPKPVKNRVCPKVV